MKVVLSYLANNFELIISNFCLTLLVAMLGLQVFFRYALHMGLSWSEEISRFAFLWFVYISGSLAAQKSSHIRVTALLKALPVKIGKNFGLTADALWICFNLVVVVSGILLVRSMLIHPIYSTSLYLPLSYIYLVIPVAHTMMILRIIEGYYKRFKEHSEIKPDFI